MYVHEEMIDGKPLTEIINQTNENVKYLPGAKFTPNVVADPDLASALKGATMISFCLPHQFLKPMVRRPRRPRRAPRCGTGSGARAHGGGAPRARGLGASRPTPPPPPPLPGADHQGERRARRQVPLRHQGHRL